MIRKTMIALAAGAALVSTAALASVTFDYASGTGFVGKGDIQTLYGWNNNAAQNNLPTAKFAVVGEATFGVTCEWFTGPDANRKRHEVTQTKTTSVNSSVAFETRKNSTGQITGINLNGFGTEVVDTPTPQVGGSCLGEGTNGTIIEVEELGGTGSVLTVTWGGITYDLPNTPII